MFLYGSVEPLTVVGCFTAKVKCTCHKFKAKFYVTEEIVALLLGKNASTDMGVFKNINAVNNCENTDSIFGQFPECFSNLGKLKDFEVDIPTDPEVTLVIQPLRRIPYNLKGKLETKLKELIDSDIIEKGDHVSQ